MLPRMSDAFYMARTILMRSVAIMPSLSDLARRSTSKSRSPPSVKVLTATPIFRTLCLTGDASKALRA